MLKPGGSIVVCSCSHHITPPILEEILLSAAYDTRTPLKVLYTTYQAKDHPFVLQIPESRYLKCIFARSFPWEV
jgi:23S rRNA (cytosine1962-C5)-methyltransferase